MTKKARYLLLLIGFVFFCIASPLIVLYVQGLTYDLASHRFVKTGILAIKTDPKSANVYVDGDLELKSGGDVKFLIPKEYNVTVKKDGYFDWSKRLTILPGQVTWASPVPNKLYLFLKDQAGTTLSSGVLDFFITKDSALYLAAGSISVTPLNDQLHSENFTLPKPASKIASSPDGKTFLLTATTSTPTVLVFNANDHAFTDLSPLFSTQPTLKFYGNNQIFALESGTLYSIDLGHKTKAPVKTGVGAFAFRENNLYYLAAKNNTYSLMLSQSPQDAGTEVLANLPKFTQAEIFVDFERQALLLIDGTLYQINSSLDKLADNITDWNFNYGESTLIFSRFGELDFYNPFSHSINYITRGSSPVSEPILSLVFSNSFYVKDNSLQAMELDTRDHQNNYVLYSGQNLQKFQFDGNMVYAYVLDNGVLKQIKIR